MAWHKGPLLAFDVESTSADPEECRIVSASLVTIMPGREPKVETYLVNCGIPIPPEATAIHGITDEMSAKGQSPEKVLALLANSLYAWTADGTWPVIVFNAAFDFTVLDRELRRHNLLPDMWGREFRPVIDPFVIDRHADKFRRGKRTLKALCEHYRVVNPGEHSSDGDALATARLAWRMARMIPGLAEAPLDELHENQRRWHAEQARDLRLYFLRLANEAECENMESLASKAAAVNADWPLRRHVPDPAVGAEGSLAGPITAIPTR